VPFPWQLKTQSEQLNMKPKPKKGRQQEHGETWQRARALYLEQPFIPAADLAELLGISRARFYICVDGLEDERRKRCSEILKRLKREESL
jgi:hypothetical protein